MDVVFVVPRDLPGPSGGTHYNEAVIAALRSLGHHVDVRAIPGAWPRPSDADREAFSEALGVSGPVFVDGILALAASEAVQTAAAGGASVHVLVHSLLTAAPWLEPGERAAFEFSEQATLLSATSASCVSQWSAHDVRRRYPSVSVEVAEPGTDAADLAGGSTPPQFLVLAALTPLKNQTAVLRAVHDLTDLPWTLQLVGSDAVDSVYAATLHELANELPPGRVAFPGALTGPDLESVWAATNLLLLTSRSETFGMVVTEALARGIPAVVPARTGAEEALIGPSDAGPGHRAGAVVDPYDEAELSGVLRAWLTSPALRDHWQTAANRRRPTLAPWTRTAQRLMEIIRR